jgi:hypothetical protein
MHRDNGTSPDLAQAIAASPEAVLVRLVFRVAGLKLQLKAQQRHLEALDARLKALEAQSGR